MTTCRIAQALEPCFDSVNTALRKPGRSRDWKLFQRHLSSRAMCKEPSSVRNKFELEAEELKELSCSLLVIVSVKTMWRLCGEERGINRERERGALWFPQTPMDLVSDCGTEVVAGVAFIGLGLVALRTGQGQRRAILSDVRLWRVCIGHSCLAAPVDLEVQIEDATYISILIWSHSFNFEIQTLRRWIVSLLFL